MKETLEKAVEMIGYGQELPEDEAIGVAVGWWPCFASKSGAYVKLNPDGSGTIITGAQENGTGSVMAMPTYVADELGMQPEDFSILYQDTDAAPWDMGSCGSQTTFNSGRAVIAAAVDLRDQLLDAAAEKLEAVPRRSRARGRSDPRQGIARQVGHDRGARRRGHLPRQERGRRPGQPRGSRRGMRRTARPRVVPRAAADRTRRSRAGSIADTGVVRVLEVAAAHDCGKILNKIGADGQVYGGVVMGIGQALSEGTQLDAEGRHRNAHLTDYKLVTASDAPKIDVAWIETDTPGRRAEGLEGRRRAAVRADRRRGRECDRQGDRSPRPQAADDTRAGLGGGSMSVQTFTTATTVDDAVAAVAAGARPVAGGTDLVVGARAGKSTMPESVVAIHRVAELHGVESLADGGLRLGALASHAEIAASDDVRERFTALSDASAIVGSHATRAQGTVGGNLMNASPAMETGGPLVCLGATATLRSPSRHALGRGRGSVVGAGQDDGCGRRASRGCRDPRACRRERAARTSGSSTGDRWRSPSSARPPR